MAVHTLRQICQRNLFGNRSRIFWKSLASENCCSIGAYNQYHQYTTPWGCGMPEYENFGSHEAVREKAARQSDFDVKYDSLKCVSNSCQTLNAKIVCKP